MLSDLTTEFFKHVLSNQKCQVSIFQHLNYLKKKNGSNFAPPFSPHFLAVIEDSISY